MAISMDCPTRGQLLVKKQEDEQFTDISTITDTLVGRSGIQQPVFYNSGNVKALTIR